MPQTLLYELARAGIDPSPGRSSVYRALIRHGLVDPKQRRRRRSDYRRWERSRAMEFRRCTESRFDKPFDELFSQHMVAAAKK